MVFKSSDTNSVGFHRFATDVYENLVANGGNLNQIASVAETYAKQLRNAVPIIAKEENSCPPILAPDFDILHRYFFPSLQPDSDLQSVRDAQQLFDEFPHKIVVLPGTENELTRHIGKIYQLEQKLKTLSRDIAENKRDSVKAMEISETIGRLSKTRKPSLNDENVLGWVLSTFSALSYGIRRIFEFFNRPNVVRYRDFHDEISNTHERNEELVEELQTMYSALSKNSERGKTFNIRNDAINMCAAILLHEKFGDIPSSGFQEPSSLIPAGDGAKGLNVLFVTTTKRILKGDYDGFSSDELGKRLKKDSEFGERGMDVWDEDHPHLRPFSISTVLRYCDLANSCATAAECKYLAKQISINIRGFGLRLEQEHIDRQKAGAVSISARKGLHEVESDSSAEIGLVLGHMLKVSNPLITQLSRSQSSRDHMAPSQVENELIDVDNIDMISGMTVLVDNFQETGLFYSEMSEKTSNGIQLTTLQNELTGRWSLRVERSPIGSCTGYWRSNLAIDETLKQFGELASGFDEVSVSFLYELELDDLRFDDQSKKPIITDNRKRTFNFASGFKRQDFIGRIFGSDGGHIADCNPNAVSLATCNFQLTCWLPHAKSGRKDTLGHFFDLSGKDFVVRFLSESHIERNNRSFVNRCDQVFTHQLV